MPPLSIHRARKQAARPYHKHDQEGDMAGENLPFWIYVSTDRLRHADNDAAGERPPQAAETANDHGLEGIEETGRTDAGVEIGARAEKKPGDGAYRKRDAHGQRIDRFVVDAHELRDLDIVGRGAEGAAESGPVEHAVKEHDDGDRRQETDQRHQPDRNAAP